MKEMFEKLRLLVFEPRKFFNKLIIRFNRLFLSSEYINGRLYHVYKGHYYPDYLNKGSAVSFIKNKALKYCRGTGLDIGAGNWPLPGAIAVRDEKEINAYKLDKFEDGSLDYIFSSHCIEHLENWREALSLWVRKVKYGGIIFIYAPHKSMLLWRPLAPWVGEDHKWSPDAQTVGSFLKNEGCEIIFSDTGPDIYQSFHIIAVKK